MKQKRHIFGAIMLVVCAAWSTVSFAASSYTVTIPATLLVQNSGWNSLGKLSATGSLEEKYELVVTASSTNGFNLVNTTDTNAKVPYVFMEKSSGEGKSYSDVQNSGQTEWKFDTLGTDAQSKDLGIVVDDYSRVKHGSYSSNVTFSAGLQKLLTIFNGQYPLTKGTKLYFTIQYAGSSGLEAVFEYDGSAFKTADSDTSGTLTLSNNVFTANVAYKTMMKGTLNFTAKIEDGSNPKFTVSNFTTDGSLQTITVGLVYKQPDGERITFWAGQKI